jgi:mRNA interferase HicA
LIRALRKYARKQELRFELDKKKGKGSHYTIFIGDEFTTLQAELTPGRIERALKQLKISSADL